MDSPPDHVADDDRPPICPACGVTMGLVIDDDGRPEHACLECGFAERRPGESEP